MEPGRINPSRRFGGGPGTKFSLSLSVSPAERPSLGEQPLYHGLSTNPGVGFSEFHGGFRGAILLLSGATVMCLPCPRLIRVLRTTLDYRYVHVLRQWRSKRRFESFFPTGHRCTGILRRSPRPVLRISPAPTAFFPGGSSSTTGTIVDRHPPEREQGSSRILRRNGEEERLVGAACRDVPRRYPRGGMSR